MNAPRPLRLTRDIVLACAFLWFAATALSQGRSGGGGQGGGAGGPGGMGGGMNGGMNGGLNRSPLSGNDRTSPPPGTRPTGNGPSDGTMSGGLQLGPSRRWWDDKSFAKDIGIDSSQQHRMDDVFSGNRGNLIKLYKNLQHEESQLSKTVRAKELDETQIFAQIDRVTQARGELEKANAHMLLQIRKEMTPDQIGKLDEHRPISQQ